ncbi:hypothetical protein [Corynebacterium glaucum]|uniref:hypothetical protein n=1 Tax=Corynebacterium glaucum TaxID=187491 RepID=UPI00265A96DE|nr:hypothetical protein [Corynebacterium glaucum]
MNSRMDKKTQISINMMIVMLTVALIIAMGKEAVILFLIAMTFLGRSIRSAMGSTQN